jgi:hypothetical protein
MAAITVVYEVQIHDLAGENSLSRRIKAERPIDVRLSCTTGGAVSEDDLRSLPGLNIDELGLPAYLGGLADD